MRKEKRKRGKQRERWREEVAMKGKMTGVT